MAVKSCKVSQSSSLMNEELILEDLKDCPEIIRSFGESFSFENVLKVHKEIKRKGKCWKSGQKIKILKGASAGYHKSNVFATLERIILEGLPRDACGNSERW